MARENFLVPADLFVEEVHAESECVPLVHDVLSNNDDSSEDDEH